MFSNFLGLYLLSVGGTPSSIVIGIMPGHAAPKLLSLPLKYLLTTEEIIGGGTSPCWGIHHFGPLARSAKETLLPTSFLLLWLTPLGHLKVSSGGRKQAAWSPEWMPREAARTQLYGHLLTLADNSDLSG